MSRPKCAAAIPNKWYDMPHDKRGRGMKPTGTHPCPFFARRGGFCMRHQPGALLPRLERQEKALAARLAEIRAALERERAANLNRFPLNPS